MSDSNSLYQDAIKQLAKAGHGHGLLSGAAREAKLHNPLCGDRIRMQVALSAGRVIAIGHETKGCLLCRASASVVGLRAIGLDEHGIKAVVHGLECLLQEGAPAPSGWPELAMFEPAREYPSRHGCALLPFHALLAAIAEGEMSIVQE